MSPTLTAADLSGYPGFTHLWRLTDERSLLEHALFDTPRREHGYCVDDVARALVVLCRYTGRGSAQQTISEMTERYLAFVLDAVTDDGMTHNRMSVLGHWTDHPGLGDWWGRAVWSLGTAAALAPQASMRRRAREGFERAARTRSPYLHSSAFAALGAGELLRRHPDDPTALSVLRDCVGVVRFGVDTTRTAWPWPEASLRYASGAIPEALAFAGDRLGDDDLLAEGMSLLDFLLRVESRDGHLSVTPVGGRGPGDQQAGYDQQPIEVSSLGDACARAFDLTGDPRWRDGVQMAWAWFVGDNDGQTAMFDGLTDGGYDGLTVDGPNLNQGAESTLAMLSTAQHARRLGLLP